MGLRTSNVVGPAFTLRYIPAREDIDRRSVFNDRSHPQRAAVETCPFGQFLVSRAGAIRAQLLPWGLLLARLARRGCAWVVADVGFRDSPEIEAALLPPAPIGADQSDSSPSG